MTSIQGDALIAAVNGLSAQLDALGQLGAAMNVTLRCVTIWLMVLVFLQIAMVEVTSDD